MKTKFSIKKTSTRYEGKMVKDEGIALLDEEKKKLHKLQEKLYADGSKSLLIIIRLWMLQEKDSLIEHVMSGINPQGCQVTSFKTPSSKRIYTRFSMETLSCTT